MMKKKLPTKLVNVFLVTTLLLTNLTYAFAAEVTAQAAMPAPVQTPFQFIFGTVQFFLVAFFVYYMLVLRPQQVKEDAQAKFITELKKDTEVVTSGGILGKVSIINDDWITVEIASGVKIKVSHFMSFPRENKNQVSLADDKSSAGNKKSSINK